MTGTESRGTAPLMDQLVNPARCWLECGSREYVFKGRKRLPAEAEQPAAVAAKYACNACGHAWKEILNGLAATRSGSGHQGTRSSQGREPLRRLPNRRTDPREA